MSIRNKDGSLFKLQGLNPLMKSQDHWEYDEGDDWKIHSVDEKEEVIVPDPKRIAPEGYPEDVPLPAIVGVGVISQTEILYCLPLIIIEEEDPLYGSKKQKTSWGNKFNFEAIRMEYTGLTSMFFARLPPEITEKMTRNSIIYVFNERQWWAINGVEPSNNGINIYCVPTPLKPSFV